ARQASSDRTATIAIGRQRQRRPLTLISSRGSKSVPLPRGERDVDAARLGLVECANHFFSAFDFSDFSVFAGGRSPLRRFHAIAPAIAAAMTAKAIVPTLIGPRCEDQTMA